MADANLSSKSVPVQITEDEAAVYDRQIRLWGLEAQQRMRNATILVMNLRGVATETIKNIVLAGIGKLVILDAEDVQPEDLGAGFFFRDEDVGTKRVDAAKARIQTLNPLVAVEAVSAREAVQIGGLENLINGVDLVCVTDSERDTLIAINSVCRRLNKPFYAGGCYGLFGYIFCDLLRHDYIAPDRSAVKDVTRDARVTASYCQLDQALLYRWTGLKKRQVKEVNPALIFSVMAVWEYQSRHQGLLPDDPSHAAELHELATGLLAAADVTPQALTSIPSDLTATLATTAAHEFSPVCAVIGGMLGQDILKALAAREAPIANFFTFDGNTGAGSTCSLNMS